MTDLDEESYPRIDEKMLQLVQDKQNHLPYVDFKPKDCAIGNLPIEEFMGPRNSFNRIRSMERAVETQIFNFADERELF